MSSSNDWIFRWIHIMAGIMWIGLLYFFNFVNAAALKEATAAGAALLANFPGPAGMNGFVAAFTFQGVMAPIGFGAWLGTIMLLNVWGVIWPNQKKLLGIVPATDEEKAKARRLAFLASRANTMLSIPMLFFMATGPSSMSQGIYH